MSREKVPPRFYVYEIGIRLLLAVVAFLTPLNILTNDVRVYWERAQAISFHHLPYQNFTWEYPPLTVLPLIYLPLTGRTSLGFHVLFVPTMIALEYASLCLLRNFKRENSNEITLYWTITVVPISMLVWYRFDYMSIFFATLALIAMERRKTTVLPVLFGFLAKLWPIFFAVPLFAQRKFKQAVLMLLTCSVGTGIWWALTPRGFHTFLQFRKGSGFQIESLPGSVLLLMGRKITFSFGALNVSDAGIHWLQLVMNVASVLGPAILAIFALRIKERNDVALLAGTVAFVLCVDRLISAQFITWLAPFIAYMWPKERRIGYIYGLLTGMTILVIGFYHALIRYNVWFDALLVARNCVLVWCTYELLRLAFRPTAPEPHRPTASDDELSLV